VAVVSRYVTLRRAGRRMTGLCPFHQEKTASFTVDPERQLWHCFGCGAGGNLFHFLMKAENLTFLEAAQRLAKEAGMELEGPARAAARPSEHDLLARINLEAAGFYQRTLASKAGAKARAYLEQRGIPAELVQAFGLGYAPAAWDSLFSQLRSAGYPATAIVRAGLCLARPQGEGCYDRFRDRLMFPIFDLDDQVVAFGGRILDAQANTEHPEAKYINSPETPLFAKGKLFYGLSQARKAMGKAGRALLVEGYLDLITCHQFGFTETVATLGTALTEHHLRLLHRYTERVYTAFDSDSAGLAATLRSRELFVQADLEAHVVVMPPGHDPDSLLRAQGREALEAALAEAPDPLTYELRLLAQKHLAAPGGEARLGREAVPLLCSVPDAVARVAYIHALAELLAAQDPSRLPFLERALHQEVGKALRPQPRRPLPGGAAPEPAVQPGPAIERHIIAAILQDEPCRRRAQAVLQPEHFSHQPYRELFLACCQVQGAGSSLAAQVANHEQHAALVAELVTAECPLLEGQRALDDALERLEESRLKRRVKELDNLISRDAGGASGLLEEYMQARRRLSQLTCRRAVGQLGPAPAEPG